MTAFFDRKLRQHLENGRSAIKEISCSAFSRVFGPEMPYFYGHTAVICYLHKHGSPLRHTIHTCVLHVAHSHIKMEPEILVES